ncbi:MAG TPA: histidine phosphatase family protein [Burkholderiales bacterium]|jgi:phosphohistidine phosphatase|nr:histidine phosphatase family protein [Burkholderiales bacterium]
MDLILWRHAEAVDGQPDLARELTPKGVKQAKAIAQWLSSRLPKQTRIIVSPAERAQQTAAAFTDDFHIDPQLAPGAPPTAVLAAAGWPEHRGAVVVVGHQPTLGMAAALLIAGEPMPWSIKKGAIWWLNHRVRGEQPQVVLRAVISPDFI